MVVNELADGRQNNFIKKSNEGYTIYRISYNVSLITVLL